MTGKQSVLLSDPMRLPGFSSERRNGSSGVQRSASSTYGCAPMEGSSGLALPGCGEATSGPCHAGSSRVKVQPSPSRLAASALLLPKSLEGVNEIFLARRRWAMVGNAQQHRWELWHRRQSEMCNLQIPLARHGFESHPLRQFIFRKIQPNVESCVQ